MTTLAQSESEEEQHTSGNGKGRKLSSGKIVAMYQVTCTDNGITSTFYPLRL
jgi:hypothetical protein